MRARIATDHEHERYNAFASSSAYADILQSWEWGEVKRRSGWTPRRFLAEDDGGRIVGSAQVLGRRPVRGAPRLLYAPRGPVVEEFRGDALGALIGEVRARAGDAFVLKCDPPVEEGSSEAQAMLDAGFVIEQLREPAVPAHAITEPHGARWQRLPLFLHVRAAKR